MSASRGADDREAFIKACADGNTGRVRRLLDRGADVDAAVAGQPAKYPLWIAVRNDRHDTVRLLLERGADVNRCPTYEALEWRRNPPPNPTNLGAMVTVTRQLPTVLMRTCGPPETLEMARLLIECGADVNFTMSSGNTALHAAAPFAAGVRLLLENGASTNDASGYLVTNCINYQQSETTTEALRLLLEHGASPHSVPPGPPPLFSACAQGPADNVGLLLDYGADPNVAQTGLEDARTGKTCLYVACFDQTDNLASGSGRPFPMVPTLEKARLLLSRGARVDPKTWLKLCMRAPMQMQYTGIGSAQTRAVVPTNAIPLRKLFLKHYAILVRLHAIGTPSTRPGPDQWLLEARHHAPLIASFLSPQATRKAWSFWDHNEDCSMMDLKWTQDYMYGSPLDW